MIISRKEIESLSKDIRRIIDGQEVDLRDNLEGRLSILKNDIHTLAGRLNEESASLKKEKSAMANTLADISHQLKTPLTAMIVMVELLETAPSDKRAEFIYNLKQGLTQTEWLASTLLKMAKLESGTAALNPVYIHASHLLDIALYPLHILLDIKDQKVNITGDSQLYCDKNWTAQALTNIIKNASEHSPEGCAIEVNISTNPISTQISITDQGQGIPDSQIKGLFNRFGNSRKGNGIGLALSLAIMREQNGDIEVKGRSDHKGATFILKFYPQARSPRVPRKM
ncbi:MAG: HAMP domain-containing histidine kinase [Defluviitaleaceae bacterium]|nr:HAMP domain-containing histidine kinase [Defluviitaleaceae bacterium]